MARRARFTGGEVLVVLWKRRPGGRKRTSEHVFALPV